MPCHLRFCIFVALVGIASSSARGAITFISYGGYSNVVAPITAQPSPTPFTSPIPGQSPIPSGVSSAPPQFYYSNISATTTTDGGATLPTYEDAVTAGGACSTALNPNCHNPSDNFTLTVQSNAPVQGGANYFYWIYAGATAPTAGTPLTEFAQIVPQQLYGPNEDVSFEATWGSICSKISGSTTPINGLGANCEDIGPTSGTPIPRGPRIATFYLVADTQSTGTVGSEIESFTVTFASSIREFSETADQLGLYGFLTFPGDQKVYLQGLPGQGGIQTNSDFPTQSTENGVPIQAVQVYYNAAALNGGSYDLATNFNATNFTPLVQGFPSSASLGVNPDGSLQDDEVTGLTDGQVYYFRVALVDMAGNIGYLTEPTVEDSINHAAIPDEVVGLLSHDQCFIATAAFGSPLVKQVKILRKFRDKFLLPRGWGRRFVAWYYQNSPPWANLIAHHESMRAVVRAGLYPLIFYSFLALKWGPVNAALALATLLMFPLLILRWKTTRPRQQGNS